MFFELVLTTLILVSTVRLLNLVMSPSFGMETVLGILTRNWKSMWKFKVTLGLHLM